MKKKITAFLLAFNIFAYTSVCCYVQPIFALPVVSADVLFNGLITLLFSLGVTLDLTGLTHEQANQTIDDRIRNGLSTLDNANELLQQYNTLLENIKNGFLYIGIELGQALISIFKNDVVVPSQVLGSVPSIYQPYIGSRTGYYAYFTGVYNDGGTNTSSLIIISDENSGVYSMPRNFSYLTPPVKSYQGSSYARWRFFTSDNADCMTEYYLKNGDLYGPANTYGTSSDLIIQTYGSNTFTYNYLGAFSSPVVKDSTFDSLVGSADYDVVINGQWVDNDGILTTPDGVIPQVIDGDVIGGLTDDIQDGTITWQEALGSMVDSYPENPAVPDVGLDLSTIDSLIDSLDLERLETKFPFCIPNDLMLIMNGATSVSSNQAPVIQIPLKIEFNGTVYYEADDAVVIDFNDFSSVVHIFREGFFLLFLIALLWVSIDILQAFFVVTE